MAVAGIDLRPLWQKLIVRLIEGTIEPGEGLDLSLIAQLLGDKEAGLAIQDHILASHRLFRSPCAAAKPRLRVLALAAATDIGSNTPIEFLLEQSAIELMTLYVIADAELPVPLPDHDIAIVIASDSPDCRDALRKIGAAASRWPQPMLNPPHLVGNLDRDKLHRVLDGIDGLEIPVTVGVSRAQLLDLSRSAIAPLDIAADLAFPAIVRPRGSHAGAGLAKIDDRDALENYLRRRTGAGILHRRVLSITPAMTVCIANAGSSLSMVNPTRATWRSSIAGTSGISTPACRSAQTNVAKRKYSCAAFDSDFARRHRTALSGIAERIGLDYFAVDCAETRCGSLLVFEADNTAIVHDMDAAELFGYKLPQMQRIFDAFATMLERRARFGREHAA